LSNLEDSDNSNEPTVDMTPKEQSILERELEDDPNNDILKVGEYIIPPKQLVSLEMQEASLAKKLIDMYDKLMNLDKSTFFYLKHTQDYDAEVSEHSD